MSKEQTQDLKSRLERILAENIQAAKNCAAASDLQEHAVQEGFAQMDNARTEFRRTRTTKNEVKYKTFIRVAQSTGRLVVQFGGTVISLIGRAWKHI
jgi:hypothetical protein